MDRKRLKLEVAFNLRFTTFVEPRDARRGMGSKGDVHLVTDVAPSTQSRDVTRYISNFFGLPGER
jgi:hypothetical protein